MKRWKLLLGLLALGLSACVPVFVERGPTYSVTEIEWLTPDASERWTYFYGDPQQVFMNDEVLNLEPAPDHANAWAFPGALWVNGQPNLREVLPPLRLPAHTVQALPSFKYVVETKVDLRAVWVYDHRWYKLSGPIKAGERVTTEGVVQTPQLDGLTIEESRVIAEEALKRNPARPVVLYQLADPVYPDYRFSPPPAEYQKVSLAVQYGVDKEFILGSTNPFTSWKLLASGPYSAYADSTPYAALAVSQDYFTNAIWPLATGRKVPKPVPPAIDFRTESVAAFFWGTKPTGGYTIKVRDVRMEGSVLQVFLELLTPPPGSLTTQSITSPYVLIRVGAKPSKVEFYDQNHQLIQQADAK